MTTPRHAPFALRLAPSVAGLLLACSLTAAAHEQLDPAHTMRAVRVGVETPRVDGDLTDEVWSRAPTYDQFTQGIPDDGEPATERTVVQFAYDENALYIAARLYYGDPSLINDKLTRRDQTNDVDRIRVEIDTFHDHQTAYMFELSAAGVQRDGHVTKNGEGFDGNWDAVWEGSVSRHEGYLGAEWRIPYQALRFARADSYTWGINVVRSVPLKHEMVYWVRIPRNERGWVSRFGHLTGIEGISPARALEVLPYTVGRTILYPGSDSDADFSARVGADVRYGLTHSTSINATINPDFGQVEADPAELNLTVFETFQSERRPFFVEGGQMFRTPIDLFYSRRIGRQPGFLPVPAGWSEIDRPEASTVLGAVKLTGKTRGRTTFGLLQAVTAAERASIDSAGIERQVLVEPRGDYVAGRLIQDVGRNSQVGLLATGLRRAHGDNAWTGGVDWKLNTYDNDYEFLGQVAGSHVGDGSGWGANAEVGKRTGRLRAKTSVQAFSPGLHLNDMGYLRRADMVRPYVELEFNNQDPWRLFRSNNVWLDGWRLWNFDDVTLENAVELGTWNQLRRYWSFGGGVTHRFRASDDRDTRGGPLIATPAADAWWVSVENDWRQATSFWLQFDGARDSAGSRNRSLSGGVTVKPTTWLELSLEPRYSWNRDDAQWLDTVDDADGAHYLYGQLDSRTLDLTTRANLILDPRLSLELYAQPFLSTGDYSDFRQLAAPDSYRFTPWPEPQDNPDFRRRSLRTNLVLRWEYRLGSTLFLVWSQSRNDRAETTGLHPLHNLGSSFTDGGTNVFFVKIAYWAAP